MSTARIGPRATRRHPLTLTALLVAVSFSALSAEEIEFRFEPPGNPGKVFLAGDFNNWNPTGQAMSDEDRDGVFTVTLELPPGKYQYKFVVDGNWLADPNAADSVDDGFGGKNSVIRIGESEDRGGFVGSGGSGTSIPTAPSAQAATGSGGARSGVEAGVVGFSWTPGSTYTDVFLAGEFNDWNLGATRMTDEDGDGTYTAELTLADGRYEYKFVADGTWVEDPDAVEFADDNHGGQNSVLYVGDVAPPAATPAAPAVAPSAPAETARSGVEAGVVGFSWTPESAYTDVFLAGEFNDWNPGATRMTDEDGDGTYTAELTLAEGRYEYKFVADGSWVEDPDAVEFADDNHGGQNSVLYVGDVAPPATPPAAPASTPAPAPGAEVDVTFSYQPMISGVGTVHLVGELNGWNTTETPMSDEDGDGTYTVTLPLAPGKYAYKFLVDGSTWLEDPNATDSVDDSYGGQNSVIHVGESGEASGPGKPRRVKFSYRPESPPSELSLAGTFNNWAAGKTPMTDPDGDGTYEVTLLLPEDSYQYKFVADGTWITDESAESFFDDGFGGQNSVVVVDDSFPGILLERGDGNIFGEGLTHQQTVQEVNWVSDEEVQFTAKAYAGDVESIEIVIHGDDMSEKEILSLPSLSRDATFEYFQGTYESVEKIREFRYSIRYRDGGEEAYLRESGLVRFDDQGHGPDVHHVFSEETIRRFATPDWVRDGVFYQIFPERFANGESSNDPDFDHPYYKGRTSLPPGGKTNGEYYHLVDDWYDVAGLRQSPYRTDGRPDYFSFYGGDIAGLTQKLDYLEDLGVTILYFNPLFRARSNHKYEAYDYASIDPHFGTEEEFKTFVREAHARGIRIVADWVINHIGEHSPYFQDTVKKGNESEYWDWFEWKQWPLPSVEPADWRQYYECWWGFAHMPDLNFDLSRLNPSENGVKDAAEADVNWPVVNYVLESARYWLGDLDIDGFRLDVPNEVPFWVWKIFRDEVRKIKPDAYLVGEIWSDAGDWVSPDCFDATMNYKYFKDPVMNFIGKGLMEASRFDRELTAGRLAYPIQATRVMMNLVGSHDTPRYLTAIGGDRRRHLLTALFAMTYVGAPHIYYGDEIAMEGGADPDCRRPFRWTWEDETDRASVHDWYRELIHLRRDNPALITGGFRTLEAQGPVYSFARFDDDATFVVVMNVSERETEVEIPVSEVVEDLGQAAFADALGEGATVRPVGGALRMVLEPVSGVVLRLVRSS